MRERGASVDMIERLAIRKLKNGFGEFEVYLKDKDAENDPN